MDELHLPSTIEKSPRVLVAGAGGGFDVYAGLPIYERLRVLGKSVFLANLSFVPRGTTNAQPLTRALCEVEAATVRAGAYFPWAHVSTVSPSARRESQHLCFSHAANFP